MVSHVVIKAASTMTVKAPDKIEVGEKAKIKVKIAAPDGIAVTGRVQVKLPDGKKLNAKIEDGKAVVTLRKAKDAGKLKLDVTYKGTNLLAGAKERVTIKVKDS